MGQSEEGLRTVYSMKAILVFSLVTVAMSAPQYGGGSSQPVKAPVQSASVQCRTEYVEVWDTKYVETESQQCQTVQEKQCNTAYKKQCVPKQRQECQTVYKSVCNTEYQEVCNQRQSVVQTTRKTVNTNGKVLVITRSGHQYREPARTMHMTNVKMCRSSLAPKFLIRTVRMYHVKNVRLYTRRFLKESAVKLRRRCVMMGPPMVLQERDKQQVEALRFARMLQRNK